MNSCRYLLVLAASVGFLCRADEPAGTTARSREAAADTVILTLPGPAALPVLPKESKAAAPAPATPKADLPEAFKSDSSAYLQHVIGAWKKQDAEALLGAPIRNRQAYDENKQVNGQIFAWADPSGRYRELELDFDDSGSLRTVFAYPNEMTWNDCRKLWGANVNATRTKNGRTFYSYLNRNLDVLVDHGGKVISLGLY
jgi:hypothetical protein